MNKTSFLFFTACVFGGSLYAQNYEQVAPKTVPLPPGTRGSAPEAPVPPVSTGSTAVLIKKLQGLILVDSQQGVRVHVAGVRGVQLHNVHAPNEPGFEKLLATHLGQPLSLASINALTREIVLFYRSHDRPVVDVIVPEQEITTGVLQLVVVEGRLGKVRAEGNRWFSSRLLESQIRLRANEPITASEVRTDLDWLNNNPFRDVNAVYTPGGTFGTTDIVLQTQDRFPVRVFAGDENSGNRVLGLNRWFTGFNWGNVFGLDHQLSYQFTASDDVRGLAAHAVTYVAPLPWHHTLTLFGSLAKTHADVPFEGEIFNEGGHSGQLSARYSIPLPSNASIAHDVFLGFDFKRTNNDLEFGGLNVFKSNTDVFQWSGGYEINERDHWGSTSLTLTGVWSPGGVNGYNSDTAFEASRAGADSRYVYGRATLQRVTELPKNFSLVLRATGQWADTNLLASEQLSEGGYSTVRGYEEDLVRGDSGCLLSAEIRSPSISLCDLFGWRRAGALPSTGKDGKEVTPETKGAPYDQLQALGFWEYGVARLHSPLPSEDKQINLSSIGVGLRYNINPYLAVRFDYGWQLNDLGALESFHSYGHFGVVLSF